MNCIVDPENQMMLDTDMRNGDFEEIEQGLDHLFVAYRKKLTHDSDIDQLQSASKDALTVLQKEVAVCSGMKWYFALKLSFRKVVDANVITDPPVVIQTNPMLGLPVSNYENDLDQVFQGILQQIDDFESNGSGLFLTLHLKIATYTLWTL